VNALALNNAFLPLRSSLMPNYRLLKYVFSFLISFAFTHFSEAQVVIGDTSSRIIQIVSARSFRQIKKDTSTLLTLAGNAAVRQGNTSLSGDSIVLNQATGIAEVFGHVHINDADTVHTYADYLKYIGNTRQAYLKNNIKLTDGKGILYTDDLDYNVQTGIANYRNGGKVINGKTVLTSNEAVYYSDTKDIYFKKAVHLTDPKYDIQADSLLYNTALQTANFIAPTRIKTESGIINTNSGTYNLQTGEAVFLDRTSFSDSTHFMSGNRIATDEKTGMIQIEGRGKLVDSANSVIVIGDLILLDRKKNAFLATRKPVMIIYKDNDSTYISADTLFSGLRKYDSSQDRSLSRTDILEERSSEDIANGNLSLGEIKTAKADSIPPSVKQIDSTIADSIPSVLNPIDSTKTEKLPDVSKDSSRIIVDTTIASNTADGVSTENKPKTDTLNKGKAVNISADSIRYFIAFHHVRIFNDSLQAVCDSLHYSTEDSTFKLFKNPVVWNGKTQVTGDTMHLYTKNQKPERLYVYFNGLVINNPDPGVYNQIGGRTINGYFKEGVIDYIRVKGSPAESIYYPQDEDSAYIGLNRSKSDVIDIYFINKELNKVKFINEVDGTLYPLRQVPEDQKTLRGFLWQDNRRPKNKLELFE
jgi:lipopolysaccharide export system protein LptA